MSQHFVLKAMIVVFDQNSYRNFSTKEKYWPRQSDRQRDKIKTDVLGEGQMRNYKIFQEKK
jgi:hypothetical protein